MNPPTTSVKNNKPRSVFRYILLGAVLTLAIALVVTLVIPATYEAEGAIAAKDAPSLSIALPISTGGSSVLDTLEGVVSSATAEYYIFYATDAQWRELNQSSGDFSAADPFHLPEIVKFDKPKQGSITAIKRADRQQLIIRGDDKTPEAALALVNRALQITDRIGSASASEPSRVGGERLLTSITRVQNELTQIEEQAVKKGMQSETGASNASDLLAFRAKVQGLRTDMKSILSQMETLRTGASALSAGKGIQPTGIPSLDSLRQQVLDTELKLKLTSESLGPSMPEVEVLRRQLNKTKDLLVTELDKYGKAFSNNMDPLWLDLKIRADALKTELGDAERLLRQLPKETLTNAKLIREQRILEQTLIQLRTQYEMMVARAEAPDRNWILLDKPHIVPLGKLQPINKDYPKNAGIGLLLGCLLGYLWYRVQLSIWERKSQAPVLEAA